MPDSLDSVAHYPNNTGGCKQGSRRRVGMLHRCVRAQYEQWPRHQVDGLLRRAVFAPNSGECPVAAKGPVQVRMQCLVSVPGSPYSLMPQHQVLPSKAVPQAWAWLVSSAAKRKLSLTRTGVG